MEEDENEKEENSNVSKNRELADLIKATDDLVSDMIYSTVVIFKAHTRVIMCAFQCTNFPYP